MKCPECLNDMQKRKHKEKLGKGIYAEQIYYACEHCGVSLPKSKYQYSPNVI